MSGFAKRDPDPIKPILPWHREAAKAANLVHANGDWSSTENPDTVIAAIIARHDPHAAQQQETVRLLPVPDKQGILFGTTWISYDCLTGYEGEDGPDRDAFYANRIIARGLMKWVNEIRTHLAALRGKGATP